MGLPLPEEVGPVAPIKDFRIPYTYFFPEESLCGDIFNRLVELIREGGNDPAFKKRVKDRERSALSNYQTCLDYVAELFATEKGLGYYIYLNGSTLLNYPAMYAGVVAMSVLGLGLYFTVDWLERRLTPWQSAV